MNNWQSKYCREVLNTSDPLSLFSNELQTIDSGGPGIGVAHEIYESVDSHTVAASIL